MPAASLFAASIAPPSPQNPSIDPVAVFDSHFLTRVSFTGPIFSSSTYSVSSQGTNIDSISYLASLDVPLPSSMGSRARIAPSAPDLASGLDLCPQLPSVHYRSTVSQGILLRDSIMLTRLRSALLSIKSIVSPDVPAVRPTLSVDHVLVAVRDCHGALAFRVGPVSPQPERRRLREEGLLCSARVYSQVERRGAVSCHHLP